MRHLAPGVECVEVDPSALPIYLNQKAPVIGPESGSRAVPIVIGAGVGAGVGAAAATLNHLFERDPPILESALLGAARRALAGLILSVR